MPTPQDKIAKEEHLIKKVRWVNAVLVMLAVFIFMMVMLIILI